jgi:nucleoside-diphosphate-sugar epimerase
MNGKKVTLIGGAGFIGHNLALHLQNLGAEVSIIDSLQVNNLASFAASSTESVNRSLYLDLLNERQSLLSKAGISLCVQDARNYHALCKLISDIEPQVVIQLAAVSHANKSNKDPYSTFDHSFRTLENALDASRGKIEHFIYFSSSMVYGHFTEDAVNEDSDA